MTTASSVRADARRHYVAAAAAEGFGATPDPSAQEGREAASPAAVDTPLTTRVRTLYEDTVVPVVAIARLAGVTERTIYKYAAKRGWRPRVKRLTKGAGGRFVPLAQAGWPVATGLKALEPEGAARAAETCERAGRLSEEAVAAARARAAERAADKETRARLRTLNHLSAAMATVARIRAEANDGDASLAVADRLEQTLARQMERLLSSG